MSSLRPFQKVDVEKHWNRNSLIGSEAGIGKTVEAIAVIRKRRREGHTGPVLVLCNNSAKKQWADHIAEWDPGTDLVVAGKGGSWPKSSDGIELRHYFHPRTPMWLVAHHESLSLPRKPAARARRKYNAFKAWEPFTWEAIIVDECHRYKSKKAQRTQLLFRLSKLYGLGLSASLIERGPHNLWALLHFLYPGQFGGYWDFVYDWCVVEQGWHGHKVIGNLRQDRAEEFAAMLRPVLTVRKKRDPDVEPDLPPVIEETVHVPLEEGTAQYRAYADVALAKDLEVRLRDVEGKWHLIIPNVLARIVRLQQILSEPKQIGIRADSVKQEWVQDYVEDNPEETIVVFTKFRATAQVLADKLDGALLIGGTSERYDEWKAGKLKVLCATIATAGESLNFDNADTAIFIDHEWSTIKMKQAFFRIDRITITSVKHVIHLVTPSSVDVLVQKALEQKWSDQKLVWRYLNDAGTGK